MAELVMDANYLVAALIKRRRRHIKAKDYWDRMEAGEHRFHLPTLVLAEVASALRDELSSSSMPLYLSFKTNLQRLAALGKVSMYDLNQERAGRAAQLALRDANLAGADAVYAALAEERSIPVKTLDLQLRKAYPGAET